MSTENNPMNAIQEQEKRHREWLAGLKPGDRVAASDRDGQLSLARVEKVTRQHGGTIVVVGGYSFDQVHGWQRGASLYEKLHLVQPTPEVVEQVEARRLRRVIKTFFYKDENLLKLPIEKLRRLGAIVKELQEVEVLPSGPPKEGS